MSRSLLRIVLLALAVVAAWVAVAVAAEVPFLTGRVTDEAEILSPATRERLAATLKAHEQATGNQVAVLTVPTLGGESVEDYATRVFESWKLGQRGKDNGVLVVIAQLEGKAGAADASTPAAAAAADAGGARSSFAVETPDMPWPMRILMGAFVFGIIGLFTFIGIMTPGVGWFLYVFLIPFWAMFPLVILGMHATVVVFVVYIVGYPIAKLLLARSVWYQKAAQDLKTTGRAGIGGFTMTSSGGSSGFSSSSSGGGFSGGGGSSGGGGASGSW